MKKNLTLLIVMIMTIMSCKEKSKNLVAESNVLSEHFELGSDKKQVLFIVSNQDTYGSSDINAANHFAEIVLAYDVLLDAGVSVDFVSPKGGSIPIGYISTSDELQKTYLYDCDFMARLNATKKPSEIDPSKYDAVYYGGGGSAMFGVPENEEIQKITMEVYEKYGGIVSAICHGTAGIVNLKTSDGNYLYNGKKINGFPDKFERKEAEYYKQFPFSIEEIIEARGGNFVYSEKGWDNYYSVDGKIVTGQDPSAAATVALKILEAFNLKNQ